MSQNCYVRVTNTLTNESDDVGPFINSGNDSHYNSESAIDWIYKQIGIIKIHTPEAVLIKHKWDYVRDEFMGGTADIKVEISNFIFEILSLQNQTYHNVTSELLDENKTPPGFN